MSQVFGLPRQQVVGTNGDPSPGALVYFYLTGTSTPSPVYTTPALSVAHSNPLAADSAGVIQPFYGDPAVTYRVTVRTASGSLLYQDDNVPGAAINQTLITSLLTASILGQITDPRTTAEIAASITPSAYEYPPGDIRRYGAVGDGLTDCSSAIQGAISQAEAGGSAVYIPVGTYLVNSRLEIEATNGITIYGEGYQSVIKGASAGTYIILLVEHPSYTAINGLRLRDFRIDGNSGGQLDAGLIQCNNAVGFVIDGLWIENGSRVSGASGVNGLAMSAGSTGQTGPRGVIRNCTIRNTSKAAINWTSEGVEVVIDGNSIRDITGNGSAPGIQLNGGYNARVVNNYVTNTEGPGIYSATDGSGNPSRNAIIANNVVHACGASATTLGDGILIANASGTNVGRYIITGNQCYDNGTDTNGGSGIYIQNDHNFVVTDNLCRNNRYDGIRVADCSHVLINGNRCTGNNLAAVSFACGISIRGTCAHVSITGNHCSDDKDTKTQSYGIQLTSGATLTYVTIEGNHLEGNAAGPLLADAGAKPFRLSMLGEKQTTGASAATVQYLSLPDDSAAWLRVSAVGKKTDGTDRAIYSREGAFYRDGGSATQESTTTTLGTDIESEGTWTGLTLGVSANIVIVQVTGLAATTIDWRAHIDLEVV